MATSSKAASLLIAPISGHVAGFVDKRIDQRLPIDGCQIIGNQDIYGAGIRTVGYTSIYISVFAFSLVLMKLHSYINLYVSSRAYIFNG